MSGAARGSFWLTGSNPSSDRCPLRRASLRVAESITGLCNWFERPVEATAAALRADVALLEEWHAKLRAAVAVAPPAIFAEPAGKGRFTVREWVSGIAAHDLYHAGQVQLLKRLAAPAAETGA